MRSLALLLLFVAGASASFPSTAVMTWYSFEDNTPANSAMSASGREITPYVSAAVPLRYIRGGQLKYGQWIFVKFLEGRKMPNGQSHTGWLRVDDYCGDGGSDGYCFQEVHGTSYPNVDVYVGSYPESGYSCSGGPAGGGQEITSVSTSGKVNAKTNYGGSRLGRGKCGSISDAKKAQPKCQWYYTPTDASDCKYCSTSTCARH